MSRETRQAQEDSDATGVAPRKGRSLLPIIVLVWASMIGSSFAAMLYYHNTPGHRNDDASVWPLNTAIKLDTNRPNLLVFVHPKCPCSSATLNELARIQTTCGSKISTHIIIYHPDEEAWDNTRIIRQALEIPNVRIFNDSEGHLSDSFGAMTSGHTFLYAPDGRRIFSGGITMARGHEGDNLGRSSIVQYILDGKSICDSTNIYGCSILNDAASLDVSSGGISRASE